MSSLKIKQFSVWLVELGDKKCAEGHEQKYDRPFFVISSDEYNKKSKTPIGFFLSTSEHKKTNKFSIQIDNESAINISQIRTLSEKRFKKELEYDIDFTTKIKVFTTFFDTIIFDGMSENNKKLLNKTLQKIFVEELINKKV